MEIRPLAYFIAIILAYLMTQVILHGLPEWRVKNHILEWYGWLGVVAGIVYVVMPWKVIPPHVPVLGHLDNIAAALMIAFSAMTASCARERRKGLPKSQDAASPTAKTKSEPLTVVLS